MDGDRYHKALQPRYQQLYKQVGQNHFTAAELAHNALHPIIRDVKGYGDAVIKHLGRVADEIEARLSLPMMRELIDRDELKQEIEAWSQDLLAEPRGKALALDACERYINDLDLTTPMTSVRQALIENYLMDVYTANFEAPATSGPGTAKHGIPHATVMTQLPQLREQVEKYVAQFAASVAKKLSFDRIRLPKPPRAGEVVELEEILGL
jgi:hypothetical protein